MSTSPTENGSGFKAISALFNTMHSALWNMRSAWIVPALGLMVTTLATGYMNLSVERIVRQEFNLQCNEVQKKISERLDDHARILLSGAALFQASDTITREKWHLFTQAQKIEKQLPGIQGIGFTLVIPREDLSRHVLEMRWEGFPEYKVKPEGDRQTYTSIILLEPFSGRNLRAFGFDMFSEPVRRMAMERARDTDAAALSGKVVLVQETDADIQAGTLMYAPVYRKDMPVETLEQRRAAIYGWVYSPYRMNDLMQGILGNQILEKEKQLHLQVFDGTHACPQSLIYECHPEKDQTLWTEVRFSRQMRVDFNGQSWLLRLAQTGGGFSTAGYHLRVWLTLFGGTAITLLLFFLIRALLNTRTDATRIAESLTAKIEQLADKQQAILSTLPIGVCFLQGRRVQLANPAFDKILGFTVGGTVGMNTEVFYSNDDTYRQVGKNAYACIDKGDNYTLELEMKRRDGSLFWCHISGRAVKEGIPERGSIWTLQDITDRKQAEDDLKQTRENYETFFNTIEEFLFVLDEQGSILHTNQTVLERLGYSREELIGNPVLMVHPPERQEEAGRIVGEMLRGEATFCPVPILTKSGVQIPVETRVSPGFWNGKPAIFGVTKDISKLRLSEEKFSKLFHINPSACGLSDLSNQQYLEVNAAFSTLLGFENKEVLGKTAMSLGILTAEARNALLLNADRNGSVTNAEADLRAKNGEIRHVLLSSENIYVQDKKFRFTVVHDITERKRAEQEKLELERQNRQLQKSESLSRMAGAIAHHFNNQLAAVIGNLEMTLLDLPSGSFPHTFVTAALQSSRTAAEISGRMLIYLGHSYDRHDPQDLSDICRQIVPVLQAAMPKNVALEIDLPSPGPVIETDVDTMHQAILNLVTNAREAMEENQGSLQLRVRTLSPLDIPASHRFPVDWQPRNRNYACLEVTDSGIGIVDMDIERLFDPFFSSKFTGRGMGLAVVLGIVRAHQGVITVESKPGLGSTFQIFFPSLDP